jgi:hypothetical protein
MIRNKQRRELTLAALFETANNEYLTAANHADLKGGDRDFAYAFWARRDNNSVQHNVVTMHAGGSGDEDHIIRFIGTSTIIVYLYNEAGSAFGTHSISGITVGTWHFCYVEHDAAANTLGLSIDDGSFTTNGYAITPSDGADTANLAIGSQSAGGVLPYEGAISSVMRWNRKLTAGEITNIYDGGCPKYYEDLTAGEKVDCVGAWGLREQSGNRADDSGNGHTMTDNNTVQSTPALVC